ncbi:hypothetical protein B0H16DRAFT_1014369 [Mycena metata]|uniref:Uncharacterized protein n=1 Tax=Mycena metata TaxID=1033252 RepID=A0AAD7N3N5_9AGAR|nr:hypothetical protein B0H16DRAFT_1014369 [Mycena metata]
MHLSTSRAVLVSPKFLRSSGRTSRASNARPRNPQRSRVRAVYPLIIHHFRHAFHTFWAIYYKSNPRHETTQLFSLAQLHMSSSSTQPVNVSPLSGSNFNPFATHPFTSYSPPAPRTAPPPRNPAPSHSHNTTGRTPPKPPKLSPTAGTPPVAPVFVPYRPEAPPPDLSQVLKKRPSGWKQ